MADSTLTALTLMLWAEGERARVRREASEEFHTINCVSNFFRSWGNLCSIIFKDNPNAGMVFDLFNRIEYDLNGDRLRVLNQWKQTFL